MRGTASWRAWMVAAACLPGLALSQKMLSPVDVLMPSGELAAYNREALLGARTEHPVPVKEQSHEGSTFVVTYTDGSTVRIRRMHADH